MIRQLRRFRLRLPFFIDYFDEFDYASGRYRKGLGFQWPVYRRPLPSLTTRLVVDMGAIRQLEMGESHLYDFVKSLPKAKVAVKPTFEWHTTELRND